MPDIDEKDIQNEKMREQEYKAVILSGDNEKIASILKLIYIRNVLLYMFSRNIQHKRKFGKKHIFS